MPKTEAVEVTPVWPNPIELPLYVPVHKAAQLAGVSYELMRKWVDTKINPIPHIRVGKTMSKALVRTAAIPEYLQTKEI